MKAKRLVSFVATSAMLMSMAAPVLAATTEELGRLNGLGVITGYTNGGTDFKPEQTITRAEFAAVAVRLLGLENAANAAKGATKFKDVTASNWASGYINLAVGNGVIKGYPDGTFKPEGKVTYAESFAMLVRVLGYEPQVTGAWPTNYVGKASQIGLLDGLSTTDFNAPATRGNIFTAADNALDIDVMEQSVFGSNPEWKVTNTPLIQAKLNYVKVEDVTVSDLAITNDSLDADEVVLDWNGSTLGTFQVVGNFDVNGSLGLTGTAWLNKTDNKIVLFQADDNVVADQIKSVSGTDITLKVKDDTFTTDINTKYYNNFKPATFADMTAGKMVNVVIKNDMIKAIYAFNLDTDLVESVDAANDKIYLSEGGGSIVMADNNAIIKDGKAIKLADIKAGDVIQYNAETGDKFYARISSASATGKMASALTSTLYGADQTYKFNVGSTQYTTAINAKYSTDDGANYDSITGITDLSDIDGKDVTAYLDSFGKVAFVKAGAANAATENAVLIKEFTASSGADGATYYVRVMKSDGTETYYVVNDDTTLNGKALNDDPNTAAPAVAWTGTDGTINTGDIVKLELDSNGTTVDNFKTFATADKVTGLAAKSDDNSTIKIGTKTVQVQPDTKFFTIDSTDPLNAAAIKDAKYMSWGDVKTTYNDDFSQGTLGQPGYVAPANVTVVFDGAKAKYVFVNVVTAVTSDTQVGVVDSKGLSGGDLIINVLFPSGTKAVKYDYTSATATGVLYTMTIDSDNKTTAITPAVAEKVYGAEEVYKVRSITSGANNTKILTVRSEADASNQDFTFIVKEGYTNYFDVTDGAVKATGVKVGDSIKLYDVLDSDSAYDAAGDGIIDFVVIDN